MAVAVASLGGGGAWAQTDGGSGFRLIPSLSAESSYVETRGRTVGENGHEGVLRFSPGLRLSSRSGRVQGSLDYTGSLIYRRGRTESAGQDFQNALNASFLAELVSNWAYIDARSTISQQSISAFGQQSIDGSSQDNANRTEVATTTISPYLRGMLSHFAEYDLRLTATDTRSRSAAGSSSNSTGGALTLRSPRSSGVWGWALTGTQQRSEYSGSNSANDNSRVNASLLFTPAPEVRFSVNGGRESVDEGVGAERREFTTQGASFAWSPGPRTSLTVDGEERYFGRSNHIAFSHRTARTVWSYSLTRDTTSGADAFVLGAPQTLFQLLDTQKQSAYPDPVEREKAILDELAARNLDPNQLVAVGFQTNAASLQSRQDFGWSYIGQRMSLSLQAFSTAVRQRIIVAGSDPFYAEATVQHGYSSTLSYRLTPETSLSGGGSRLMTFATTTQPGTDLKSANLGLTSQIGRRTSLQGGLRYTVFNSPTNPYRETSASGSISMRF